MTDTEIVNAALGQLGCNSIPQLGDITSAEGRVAKAQYAAIRDSMLGVRQWTFAKTRDQLVQDGGVPAFGFAYRYNLPNSVISVIRCYQSDGMKLILNWVREGPYILTDQVSPVFAEMLVRVTEGAFHPTFVKALIAQLAADWAMPLTENRALADSWETKAAARLIEAAVADGKQGTNEFRVPQKMRGRRR